MRERRHMNNMRNCVLFLSFLMAIVIAGTLLFLCPVLAATEQTSDEEKDQEIPATPFPRLPPGLEPHKPTYFLFTWTSFDEDRHKEELKFQLSFKQRLFPWGELINENKRLKLYFGYTQKSLWQVFDTDRSSPFRETNYNPEVFVRTCEYQTNWGVLCFDVGYEHESNGQNIPASRSWDRLYLKPKLQKGIFSIDYKLWLRFEEDEKEDEFDTQGDDNPDIEDFYGYGELNFRIDCCRGKWRHARMAEKLLHFDKSVINVMLRYNMEESKGAVQADYFLPMMNSIKLHFQFWDGYGESLIDYDRSFTKYGFGVALVY